MYKCEECGAEFEYPIKGNGIEKDSCPNCGDWAFKEMKPCKACGEYCIEDSGFCECCRDEAVDMLKIDFNHFGNQNIFDMIDLFTEALDKIYVNERMARRR